MKNLSKNIKILLAGIIVLIIGFLFRLEYAGEVDAAYTIAQSARFNDDDSAYLSRTPAGAGDRKTWTWSGWVKRGNLGAQDIFSAGTYNSSDAVIYFHSSDSLNFFDRTTSMYKKSSAKFRDPAKWNHVVVAFDSTETLASDRIKMYTNGVQITDFESETNPSLNQESYINTTSQHRIGDRNGLSSVYLDGYLSDIHFIDGQALTPTDFGETDTNGYWRPKAYGGTYGTNGFHLDFADSADLGNDVSGNANDWTSNNMDATDQMSDTPTSSFATFNPLAYPLATVTGSTHSEGNLQISRGASWGGSVATIPIPTMGKWAFKAKILGTVSGTNTGYIGIGADANGEPISSANTGNTASWYTAVDIHGIDGGPIHYKFSGGSDTTHHAGSASSTNDEYEFLIDRDAGTVDIKRNGVAYGTQLTGLPATHNLFPYVSVYSETILMTFDYTPSEVGYNTLSTNNLPMPDVTQPNLYFEPKTYTGTGALQSITSLNFEPALTWLKDRTSTNAHGLFDALRNTYPYLSTNATTVETSSPSTLTAFLSNGFTLGANSLFNTNTNDYISWNWKEDADAGFDVVGYSGTGVAQAISHGLGAAPAMMLVKERTNDGGGGYVYHQSNTSAPETDYLRIDSTDATVDNVDRWNDTAPTTTHFTVGTHADVNGSDDEYIAYLWAEKEGYSKFGSYTGNGSTDGPFVYLGFKPAYVMIKRSSGSGHWYLYDTQRDTFNPVDSPLYANQTNTSVTSQSLDILSNGFKIRTTASEHNQSGQTIIYAAFAEQPFKESAEAYNLTIDESARFNDDDSAYLSRTPAGAGDRKTWTWSGWVKRGNIDVKTTFFSAGTGVNNTGVVRFDADNALVVHNYSGSMDYYYKTSALFRDPSAWYHVAVSVDTTNVTAADRVKIYVNGERITDFSSTTNPSLNLNTYVNNSILHTHGTYAGDGTQLWDGYLSDIHFIDGQALTPTDFGETDANGYWRPKAYGGTYGTNGFHLDFADSADLGNDVSGNANDWTSNNLDATDQVIDTPTNSFATINPISSGAGTFSEGSLKYVSTTDTGDGTIGAQSGKYYWEVTVQSNNNSYIGVLSIDELDPNRGGSWTIHGAVAYKSDGDQYNRPAGGSSNTVAYGSSYTAGDVIGVALDIDSDQITFYKNNVSQGVAAEGPSYIRPGGSYSAVVYGTSSTFLINFGANAESGLTYYATPGGYFKYEPPTGFKALSTNNLTAPTTSNPKAYFEAVAYEGNGTTKTVTGNTYIETFTESTTWTVPDNVTSVEYLVVGGGGGGGNGGGGGGGFVTGDLAISTSTITVTVGAGGAGGVGSAGSNGEDSVFGSITALGGGGGGDTSSAGLDGGSGGGAGLNSTTAGSGTVGQGNDGGVSFAPAWAGAAGGGGAGAVGGNGSNTGAAGSRVDGSGGAGLASTISGSSVTYAGGGGGGSSTFGTAGSGGSGGGGAGSVGATGTSGTANTGGGGGGAAGGTGGAGGSGIVIIKYEKELQFQPALTWLKDRTSTNAHGLFDAVRNIYPYLSSNATTVETSSTNALTAFLENGFTLGANSLFNTNINDYISWNWKEDADAGFDVVNYTGTGSAHTESHSLSATPDFIVVKDRGATNDWAVYHSANTAAPETDYLLMNSTAATADGATYWNDTAPTTTNFTVGTNADVNTSGNDYTAYLWAEKEGYSKFGSYTGNGSTDGPFVYLGFKPAYVMVKRTNTTANWLVTDNVRNSGNPNGSFVRLNTNDAETDLDTMDFDSNGFKVRTTDSGWNTSGHTYIYAAFAEQPFALSAAPAATNYLQRAVSFLFGMQF
jgi:hypothetical protein